MQPITLELIAYPLEELPKNASAGARWSGQLL